MYPIPKTPRKSGKLPGRKMLLEICTDDNSTLGRIARSEYKKANVIRITKDMDWTDPEAVNQTISLILDNPGISAHASLPCTAWSSWQQMALHKYKKDYAKRFEKRRKESRGMLKSFIECADLILDQGGDVTHVWVGCATI